MGVDTRTQFRLDLPGLEIEISGDKRFVEDLFGRISHDLLPVLTGQPDQELPGTEPSQSYTWIYGCTEYFNKVYAVRDTQINASILGGCIRTAKLRRIYLDQEEGPLFPALAQGQQTLWAEFTEEGREHLSSHDQ